MWSQVLGQVALSKMGLQVIKGLATKNGRSSTFKQSVEKMKMSGQATENKRPISSK